MEIETKLKHNDKLPHNFTDLEKKDKILLDAVTDEGRLNEAVQYLTAHNIKCSSVDELQAVSNASVKSYIMGECKKFLNASGFIPIALQNETKMRYNDAYEELKPYVTTIEGITAKYKEVGIIQDEEGQYHFNHEALQDYATASANVHVPKIYRDAYEQYKKLANCLKEVHQWEIENNFSEVSVNGVLNINPIDGHIGYTNIYSVMFGTTGGQKPTDFTPERFLKLKDIVFGVKSTALPPLRN